MALTAEGFQRPFRGGWSSMASAMAGMEALSGVYDGLKARMSKTVDDFRANLLSVRTGRANVHMLDGIKVDYYGTETALNELAQIKTPEANLIVVEPFDPSVVTAIEKAIRMSQHGFNPMHDGKIIRVPIPPMTEERRRDAVKLLAGTVEDHKTSIRNIRRDGNETVKKAAKDKLISADDEKRANEEIQQLTDTEIKRIEELFKAKEKEVMTL
jgi:ribosome recycling factor